VLCNQVKFRLVAALIGHSLIQLQMVLLCYVVPSWQKIRENSACQRN